MRHHTSEAQVIILFIPGVVFLQSSFRQVALPAHVATIFAVIGLIFTVCAAPAVMSIRTMENNGILLQKAFDKFRFWGLPRAIAQLCSFIACVWVFAKNVFNAKAL